MRTFRLFRWIDETGVSGDGVVAHGVEFPDGVCVLHWTREPASTGIYPSLEAVRSVHGHGGRTEIQFV